jgi:hypothetical protein
MTITFFRGNYFNFFKSKYLLSEIGELKISPEIFKDFFVFRLVRLIGESTVSFSPTINNQQHQI